MKIQQRMSRNAKYFYGLADDKRLAVGMELNRKMCSKSKTTAKISIIFSEWKIKLIDDRNLCESESVSLTIQYWVARI